MGFVMAVLSYFAIPTVKTTSTVADRRVDYIGSISFMLGIVGVIYYLSEGPANGWSAVSTLVPFCIGLVLLVIFLVIEYKIDYPIMPLHIWRSRRFVSSCAAIVCNSASANAVVFFISLTFQKVQGYSSLKASLAFLVYGLGCMATVMTLTKLVTMVRTKVIMIVGWLCFVASGIIFAQIKPDSSYWSVAFPALILNFLGVASTWLCCQVNSVADADDEDQGVVAAGKTISLNLSCKPMIHDTARACAEARFPSLSVSLPSLQRLCTSRCSYWYCHLQHRCQSSKLSRITGRRPFTRLR
jgi:hypothetical protein